MNEGDKYVKVAVARNLFNSREQKISNTRNNYIEFAIVNAVNPKRSLKSLGQGQRSKKIQRAS